MAISITPSPFGSVTVTLDGELGGVLSVSVLATSNSVLDMAIGTPGPAGEQGEPGANGVGVAAGGTTGQALVKLSGTNYDTGWTTISGGGGTWGSITGTLSSQTDLYNALEDKLNLTGGSMTGDIAFLVDGNGDDTAVGSFGLGTENTDGKVAYIEPTQIRIYDSTHLIGTSLNGTGITFNDETTQTTAGIVIDPNEGGINFETTHTYGGFRVYQTRNDGDGDYTAVGVINTYGVSFLSEYNPNGDWHYGFADGTLYFKDESEQTTAFPPADGTTLQFIDGTGALQTYGPLGDRYLTSSTSTLTVDSGNGKTMTVGTGLSYSRQQDITVSYSNAIHMHGTVLTYDSGTGVMTFDSNTHSGSGTYSNWQVNVGGVAGAVLPVGGTTGQVLAKINSTNFNTEWKTLGTMSTEPASAYLSTASAVANYLTISSASSTYQTQSAMSAYLSTASAVANYLTISNASSTYQTQSGMSAYLSTSAAASTYQTQAGMSAYLSTASAVANYQSISGMSAYLSTASASANFIGTSAYATTAQAQAGTSTTTVISPSTFLDAKFFAGSKYANAFTWTAATSGTGSGAFIQGANARYANAPTSATGYGINSASISNAVRGGAYTAGIDFSKRVTFGGRFSRNVTTPDANSVFRYSLGKTSSTDASDLSIKGLMIKVAGTSAMQFLCHNGTGLDTKTSTFTPVNSQAYDVVVTSDGSGNATLYVNGSSVATSSSAPISAQGANYYNLTFETQNTSALTNGAMAVCGSDFFVQVNT
jgi:hypothetical protein